MTPSQCQYDIAPCEPRHPAPSAWIQRICKHDRPQRLALEAARTRLAGRLGRACGHFVVPRVLDDRSHAGTLCFEYLPGLKPLAECIEQSGPAETLCYHLGEVLGLIHDRLTIPPEWTLPAPAPWTGEPNDTVAVHGDFNLTNVCLQTGTGRLVVLDWSTAPALPFTCTHASRYLDLAQIIRCLLLQQRRPIKAARHFDTRCAALLAGYRRAANHTVDPARLRAWIARLGSWWMTKQVRQHKWRSLAYNLAAQPWFKYRRWPSAAIRPHIDATPVPPNDPTEDDLKHASIHRQHQEAGDQP